MGHFAQLNDDDAELLSGGKTNPSTAYGGSNYGQYKKSGGTDPNPSSFRSNKKK
ncbi:MAG: hypothetical protein ACOVNL_03960 [Prochlorococcaceae cyanobacterium]|jgi:hypothetical protein